MDNTSLTCTHSYFVPRSVSAVVAVKAPVDITNVGLGAVLSCLLGTHLAAVTAVREQADARRAYGDRLGTLAWPLTVLFPGVSLGRRGGGRGQHGCGGGQVGWRGGGVLGSGLWKRKHIRKKGIRIMGNPVAD